MYPCVLDVRVFSTYDIATSIVNHSAMTTASAEHKGRQRQEGANSANNHEDHSDCPYVEAVLVLAGRHGKVQNCADGKYDEASD